MHLSFSRTLILPSSSHTNLNLSHKGSFLRAAGVSGHGLSVAIQEVRSWKRELIIAIAENCCLLLFTHLSLSLSLCGAPLLAVSLFLHWMAADHCCRYWLLWAVCLHMLSAMLGLVYCGNYSVLFVVTTPTNSHSDILYSWTLWCIPPIKHLKYLPTPITVRQFRWTLVFELVPKSSQSL